MTKRLTAQQIADQAEAMKVPELAEILPVVAAVDTTPARRKILAVKLLPQAVTWSKKRKAAYARVGLRTWYNAEHDPGFKQLVVDFIKSHIGQDAPEIWTSYIFWAKAGDRYRQERILEQLGILDKPEKGGDTNIAITVTVEEREKLKREEEKGLARFIDRCGYDLVVSDN